MKKVLIAFFCLSLTAGGAYAQEKTNANAKKSKKEQKAEDKKKAEEEKKAIEAAGDKGIFKFMAKDNTHDYGEVPEGPTAEYDFEFKNIGKSPIIITEAHGSCGCTVPQWPHEPIAPKKTAKIHVTYNTQGRPGPIMKDVYITSNASEPSTVLHIRGTVKPKAAENAPAAPASNPASSH